MPRPRRKKSKMYFGTPAQEAIIAYNKCKNQKKKNQIYNEGIKYPFEKLAENVLSELTKFLPKYSKNSWTSKKQLPNL